MKTILAILSLVLILLMSGCSTSSEKKSSKVISGPLITPEMQKEIYTCQEFTNNVLEEAYQEAQEVQESEEPVYHFVADEAKAISFLSQFAVNKFSFEANNELSKRLVYSCTDLEGKQDNPGYCESAFPAYHFFRSLALAVKNYQWGKNTKNLATKKLLEYVNEAFETESHLEMVMGLELLEIWYDHNLLDRRKFKGIKKLKADLHAADEKLRSKAEVVRPFTCEEAKAIFHEERSIASEYSFKWKQLISDNKIKI